MKTLQHKRFFVRLRSINGSVSIKSKAKLEKYRRIQNVILDIGAEVDVSIVDGADDKKTLRHLGFNKAVFTRSEHSYLELADKISKKYKTVAVLTDFDSEGMLANERLTQLLLERKIKVCMSCRETLGTLLKEESIATIEGIYQLLI